MFQIIYTPTGVLQIKIQILKKSKFFQLLLENQFNGKY
jgi:hypothetical protein